jgi:hypothetical protein
MPDGLVAAVRRVRLAACYRELEETRAKVPRDVHQVSFEQPPALTSCDPLIRLFAAIAPPK